MSHIRISSRIFARWIACLAFSAFCLAAVVRADTVKLNDGTVVEGDILSEDETQLVINAAFASGTITEKQTLNKSDIAQITRLTAEQKAARDMERAYQKLQHYQLDPAYSFSVSQYDQVINDVFQPFLAQYTNSPYTAQIQGELAQWQAERDQVASGKARYKGQWMSADAAATLLEHDHLRNLFDLGQQYLAAGKFAAARDQFTAILATAKEQELIDRAKDLYTQTSQAWLNALQQQQQNMADVIKSEQDRLNRVREQRDGAESRLKHDVAAQKHSDTYLLGDAALVAQDNAAYAQLRTEYDSTAAHLNELNDQQAALEQQIADVQAKAGIQATQEASAAAQPPPPPASVLDASLAWVKKNWIFAAAGCLIGLWAFSRLFR